MVRTDDGEVDSGVSGGRVEEVDAAPVQPLVGALHGRDAQVRRLRVRLKLHARTVQAVVHPVLAANLVAVSRVVPAETDEVLGHNALCWITMDSVGSPWGVLGQDGQCWVTMGSVGSLWAVLGHYGR